MRRPILRTLPLALGLEGRNCPCRLVAIFVAELLPDREGLEFAHEAIGRIELPELLELRRVRQPPVRRFRTRFFLLDSGFWLLGVKARLILGVNLPRNSFVVTKAWVSSQLAVFPSL